MDTVIFAKQPPPYNGMTVATRTFSRMLEKKVSIECIDTSSNKMRVTENWIKRLFTTAYFVVQWCASFLKLLKYVRTTDVRCLYFVASPSVLGLIRNVVTITSVGGHVDEVVAHVHNGNYDELFKVRGANRVLQYLVNNTDRFIFTSKMLSERTANNIPGKKIKIVRNTIDHGVRCKPKEVKQKINERRERKKLRVLYLSNMIESKGYMDLAQALVYLTQGKKKITFKCNFIGEWPDEASRVEFLNYIEKKNLAETVACHGSVTDRSTIKNALLGADVFVLPTYYSNEAQPLSIVEAMNAGTPIVATRHASIPEYVIDGLNGYLVDTREPMEIAKSIRKLHDYDNWRTKAQNSREIYQERHSSGAVEAQFFEALGIS